MYIDNGEIVIGEEKVSFGDNYTKVLEQVKDSVYTMREPNIKGSGHIILLDVEFYGFKGICTFHFRKNILEKIDISLNWKLSDFNNNGKWKGLTIVDVVNKAALLSRKELEKLYRKVEVSRAGRTQEFETGNILIITEISRDSDDYTVAIQKYE
jgi:hypothetical protein